MAYLGASPKQRSFRQSPVYKAVGGETTVPLVMVSQDGLLLLNGSVLPYGVDWNVDPSTQNITLTAPAEIGDEFQILDLAGFNIAEMLSKSGGSLLGAINFADTITLNAAATTDIGAANSNNLIITGTATITSFGGNAPVGAHRFIRFSGGQTLTHNVLQLLLPGQADIVTESGDTALAIQTSLGIWKIALFDKNSGYPLKSLVSRFNYVVNGNFEIWQRGTTVTSSAAANAFYGPDRWLTTLSAASSSTVVASIQNFSAGQTEVPGNPMYFSRFGVTSVGSNPSVWQVQQPVEAVKTLSGSKATISFWAKSAVARSIAVGVYQNFGTSGSATTQIVQQVLNIGTTWKKYSVTVDVPSIAGKTLGANNFLGLMFLLYKSDNSVWQTPSGAFGTAPTAGDYIDLSQVKLEEGAFATPYDFEEYGVVLTRCQRFYEVLNGTNATNSGNYRHNRFSTLKRTIPSLTLISGSLAGADMDNGSPPSISTMRTPANAVATSNSDWQIAVSAEF